MLKILRRQLERLERVLEAIGATGAIGDVQRTYDSFSSSCAGSSEQQVAAALDLFSESMRHTLLVKGVPESHALWLSSLARRNLAGALVNEGSVDFQQVLTLALQEWRRKTEALEGCRALRNKTRVGYARLVAAGGAIIFDAEKFLAISPAPTFLVASFVAGGMLFFQGIDQIMGV
ncbi:MAG TPA: hypothetical protein VFZ65_14780 [Planctomycetota bacterium]|nr:hypothetical protein [Planctomycetota bacterium]